MTFYLKYKNKFAQIIELLKNYLIIEENLHYVISICHNHIEKN